MDANAFFVFVLGVIFVFLSVLAFFGGRKISSWFLETESKGLVFLFTIFLAAALMLVAFLLFQLSWEKAKGEKKSIPSFGAQQIDV